MVVFLSGVYGVGKSTIGNRISEELGWSIYSASKLISESNGELYGKKKWVNDKIENQKILISAVNNILEDEENIILDGHFCIISKSNEVEALPEFVYQNIPIKKIIVLKANTDDIIANLLKRDKKDYSSELIEQMIQIELDISKRISNKVESDLLVHHLDFPNPKIDEIIDFIKER